MSSEHVKLSRPNHMTRHKYRHAHHLRLLSFNSQIRHLFAKFKTAGWISSIATPTLTQFQGQVTMAIYSAFNFIRLVICVHLTISYLLLTSPAKIVSNGAVQILGESMGFSPIPAKSFESSPAITTLAGILFGLIAYFDLTSLTTSTASATDNTRAYWEAQAPARLLAFMGLTAYTYIFKPRRTTRFIPLTTEEEKLAGIRTGLVFTLAFFEMVWWFWIYIQLREEKRDMQVRLARERAEKEAIDNFM